MSNQDSITDVLEQLAHRIHRSVALDDADLNYVGHSSHHFHDEDRIRLRTLVERQTPAPIREYVMSHGLRAMREPYLLPATHKYGFDYDRLIVPLRSRYELLGLLWIIHDAGFSDDDLQHCAGAAEELEGLMLDRSRANGEPDQEIGSQLTALISGSVDVRFSAVEHLRALGLFGGPHLTAVVIRLAPAEDEENVRDHFAAIRRAWDQSTAGYESKPSVQLSDDRVLGVLGTHEDPDRSELVALAEGVCRRTAALSTTAVSRMHIGIGSTCAVERADIAYEHAEVASSVALERSEQHVLWHDHPLEGLIRTTVQPSIHADRLPVLLSEVMPRQSEETLETLQRYLDTAGSAADTAAALHVHRATVYYRLRQFEEATGIDVGDGRVRLMLHLWLTIRGRITPSSGRPS